MSAPGSREAPVTIVLRPIGVPLPLGFSALAVGSVLVSAQELGWIGSGDRLELGVILAAVVFPLQIIAAILSFLDRDPVAGTAAALTSAAWLVAGLSRIVPSSDELVPGFALAAIAGALAVPLTPAWMSNRAVFAVLAATAARFLLSAAHGFGAGASVQTAAGVLGIAVFLLAVYTALALALESAADGPSLPLLRHGSGWAAVAGGFEEQVRSIEHEGGVRRQI